VFNDPVNLVDPTGEATAPEPEPMLDGESQSGLWTDGDNRTPEQKKAQKNELKKYSRQQEMAGGKTPEEVADQEKGIKGKYKDQPCGKTGQQNKEAIDRAAGEGRGAQCSAHSHWWRDHVPQVVQDHPIATTVIVVGVITSPLWLPPVIALLTAPVLVFAF